MITKLDKNIYLVDLQKFLYPHCNCLWIEDDITCLIDTSSNKTDLAYLKKQSPDLIINTHGHIDHCLYNNQYPDSHILMHPADHLIAGSAEAYLEEFAFPKLAPDPHFQQVYMKVAQYQTTRIDGEIEDEQVIHLGTTQMEVLHLPGHSSGHCGFLFPRSGFIYTADIDLAPFGPWYGTLHASVNDFLQSIERILSLKPDYIVCSHGEAIIKEEWARRLKAYRDIIYARRQRIIELLHTGHHSLDEIAGKYPVYRTLPSPEEYYYLYEQVMVLNHLQQLIEQGYVIQDEQRYYLKPGLSPGKIL